MQQYVLLCKETRTNDFLNLDYWTIRYTGEMDMAFHLLRAHSAKSKRLGYKVGSHIDEYGRVWLHTSIEGNKRDFIVCTEQVARQTMLIP